jgi:ribosomal protein S18 acetylase RimI-like enzyme
VTIRAATLADRDTIHRLYRDFYAEWPRPHYAAVGEEAELAKVDEVLDSGVAAIAEDGDDAVGFALAWRKGGTEGFLGDLYVRPEARRSGIARGLMRHVADALREAGATHVTLYVDVENAEARAIYRRWGFTPRVQQLVAELDALLARVAAEERLPSFGSMHVQSDDLAAVERAVRQFVPRLPGGSAGSVVSQPHNGWIAVHDELCDRDPRMLRRLARELSDRMGAVVLALGVEDGEVLHYDLMERGRVVDEYLSVPEYYGPRPPGEVVSLAANPRLLARLTGADPARIRAIARTGSSPSDLPPAPDLLAELAEALGLFGGEHGYAEARGTEGSIHVEPG